MDDDDGKLNNAAEADAVIQEGGSDAYDSDDGHKTTMSDDIHSGRDDKQLENLEKPEADNLGSPQGDECQCGLCWDCLMVQPFRDVPAPGRRREK